jgi:hypothetical protein
MRSVSKQRGRSRRHKHSLVRIKHSPVEQVVDLTAISTLLDLFFSFKTPTLLRSDSEIGFETGTE